MAPIKKKSGQASGTRKSLRLQNKPPVSPTPHPPAPVSQPAGAKRKRSQDPEAEAEGPERVPPSKLRRGVPPRRHELSERNLSILMAEMDSAANIAPPLKRTLSSRYTGPSDSGAVQSPRPSGNNSVYRYEKLAAFKIHIHAEPLDYIQAAIDGVVNAKVSKKRRADIRVICQQFRDSCLAKVRAQVGEDDLLEPLKAALSALGLKSLCTRQKADWREELKPVIPQESRFSLSYKPYVEQREVGDASTPPRKRQQKSTRKTYKSPESLNINAPPPLLASDSQASSMMPPSSFLGLKAKGDRPSIKTPRPDISIGIKFTALTSALSSQNFDQDEASDFLTWLQTEMVEREPGGPLTPMLISVPAPRALDLAFPFAIIEGKAYSTGKQLFEAENQAAVSGACGLKIQLDLDDLVKHATSSDTPPTSSDTKPPLFFSICTQGPIHELWAHWVVVKDGVHKYNSSLLDSCNALLLGHVEDFMVKLNNVGVWGTGPFMESVVERLGKVARKAKS